MQDFIGESFEEERNREAADLQSELAQYALEHGWRWCPACREYTLGDRCGACSFCGGPTSSPAPAGVTGPQGPSVACTAPLSRSAGRDTRSGAPGERNEEAA